MGLAERDYHRTPRGDGPSYGGPSSSGPFGGFNWKSVTGWLLIANVAIFAIDKLIRVPYQIDVPTRYFDAAGNAYPAIERLHFFLIQGLGHFSAHTALFHFQVWRFITFQFLHASISHLFGNMLSLYIFGPMIERYLGSRRYLYFYIVCGIGGPIAYLLFTLVGALPYDAGTPLVGASAGIFGVLIAAARVAPNDLVLIFGVIPMRVRTLAWAFVGIAAFTVITAGHSPGANAGGEAAHLGGAVLGFFLIRHPDVLTFKLPKRRPRHMRYDG